MSKALTLSSKAMLDSILTSVKLEAEKISTDAVNMMKSKSVSRKIKNSWVNQVSSDSKGVTIQVGNSHVYAWIMNYGSGRFMDRGGKNKGYQDYINSAWFNDERLGRGHAVLSRQEEYTQIDYKSGSGTVRRSGSRLKDHNGESMNLEQLGRKDGQRDGNGDYISPIQFVPQKPEYFMDDTIDFLTNVLTFEKVLEGINLSSFIKGVGGK